MFLKHFPSIASKTSTFSIGKNGQVVQTLSRTSDFLEFLRKKNEEATSGPAREPLLDLLPKSAFVQYQLVPGQKPYRDLIFRKIPFTPVHETNWETLREIYLQREICVSRKADPECINSVFMVTMGYDLLKRKATKYKSRERHWVFIAQCRRPNGGTLQLPFNRVLGEMLSVLSSMTTQQGELDKYEHTICFQEYPYGNWDLEIDWTTNQVLIHSPLDSIQIGIDEVDSFIDELTQLIFNSHTMPYFNSW